MNWKDAKKQLLKDPKLNKAYNRSDPIYWVRRKLTDFKIYLKGVL